MLFEQTDLEGVLLVRPEVLADERGFFARSFCAREFTARGLNGSVAQCSLSFNRKKGTLRGMHFQRPPCPEARLVRCTRGAIYDVVLDIRAGSPTFRRWIAAKLDDRNRCAIYVPEGFAHGFQTLVGDTEVVYQMSEFYDPDAAAGVRWDDPAFAIRWPAADRTISARDLGYPDFRW